MAHDHDLVGEVHRLLLVVRHEDRRHVHLVVQVSQPGAELLAHARVERAERLVEEEHVRLDGKRARERHPLSLPARELRGVAVGEPTELHELEELFDALLDLALRPPSDLEPECDVLPNGHVLERGVVLEHEPDPALLRRPRGDVVALDQHAAGVGLLEARDDPEQRRFAAAARPEERRQRAGGDVDRDVVERDERPELLRHGACLDHLASFGLKTLIATSVAIASSASTTEAAYAPT
jgi:hypothetical protein